MEPDGGLPQPRNRHRNPRLGGGSFALRLIALCLVPVLGLGWLGTIRVQQLDESVREAELILASAELHGSLIALSATVATAMIHAAANGGDTTAVSASTVIFACLTGILVCGLFGLFSGTISALFEVPSFIVTLAVMMMARA